MDEFTHNLEDLNQRHSILSRTVAGSLARKFPQLEHAFTGGDRDELALKAVQATANSGIITLLPLTSADDSRRAVTEALSGLTAAEGAHLVIDLDMENPSPGLLEDHPAEGLSDHFLYGVSLEKILLTSRANPMLRIISAGTYTPRAGEIYSGGGWDQLLEWAAGQTDGNVILLGPPLDRFTDLAFLPFTDRIVVLAPGLDEEMQQGLTGILAQVAANAGAEPGISLLWTAPQPVPEPEGKPAEEETAADQEAAPAPLDQEVEEAAPASLDQGVGEADVAAQEMAAEPEPVEEAAEPAEEAELPAEEAFTADEKEEAPPAGPESPAHGIAEAAEKAGGLTEDELGLPDLDPLDEEVLDISEPGVPAEEAGQETSAGDQAEEEEIFLPDELLFLDDDELRGKLAGKRAATGRNGIEELPDLRDVEELEGTLPDQEKELAGQEEPAARQKLEPVELALGEEDTLDLEPVEVAYRPGPVEAEAPASTQEPETAATVQDSADEIESQALFTATDEEDQVQAEADYAGEPAGEEEGEPDQAAIERMKSFEQTFAAPAEEEAELVLDADPLGTGESVPMEEEAGAQVEQEAAGAAEEEDIEELGHEELETLDVEHLEPVEEAEPPEAEEPAVAAEESPAAAMEPEAAPLAEELAAAGEAGQEEAVQTAEAAVEKAPALEEIGEEVTTAPAAPEEAVAAKPAAVEEVAGPSDDEIDSLLSGASGLDEIGGDLALEEIGEEKPASIAKARAKGPRKKKKSRAGSLVAFVFLLALAGGMFFIWKQGTVSSLVRRFPVLNGIASRIPGLVIEDRTAQVQPPAADSLLLARQAEAPPAPSYDKLEYSIQLGSFRFLPQAIKARDVLASSGLAEVYVVPLDLDSLGTWNRLYVGMYETAEQCDTALAAMQAALRKAGTSVKLNDQAIARHTPLTLKLAESGNTANIDTLRARLETNHIPTYLVKISADSTGASVYRLYSGAFENEDQALYLRNQIFNLGIRAEIIQREGPAKQAS
ncbi:MAG: SPOR domain-containing protein [Candidatus Glassbacteria bacterium]